MSGAKRVVCALGVCLVAVAGCGRLLRPGGGNDIALTIPVLSFTELVTQGQVTYTVSVDKASVSLQEALRKLDLPVEVSRDSSGTVRLRSSSPKGPHFALVLRPDRTGTGTHATLEWDNVADSEKGVQFLLDLDFQKKAKDPGAQK